VWSVLVDLWQMDGGKRFRKTMSLVMNMMLLGWTGLFLVNIAMGVKF
jgi:hypothetical protein